MAALAKSLLPQIKSILSKSDLSTVSAKAIRKELVSLGADEREVKAARKEIDEVISDIYDRLTTRPAPPATASSSRPPASYRHAAARSETPTYAPSSQPIPLLDVKPKVKREVKAEYAPVKEETDAEMAERLQREYDGLNSGRASRSTGAGAPKPKKKRKTPVKRKSRAVVGSGSDGEGGEEGGEKKKRKAGGGGAFNKELILSDALSSLVDEPTLSRPQTVKRIWEYVKERDLQDPSDKRYIMCDERMRAVFHTDRLHMFTMNKILGQHFMDPDDVIDPNEDKKAILREKKPKVERDDRGVGASGSGSRSHMAAYGVGAAEEEEDDVDGESGYESSDYCGKSSGLL